MKKILHSKQFIAKDRYYLPQDDQSDAESNQQKQSFTENKANSRIQIKNFTENGNIKINIQIDDPNFSQLKVVSRPGKWKKYDKNTQNQTMQDIEKLQKSCESIQSQSAFKISSSNNQVIYTPVKVPQYPQSNYGSNSSSETVKPFQKQFYNHKNSYKDQLISQNPFQTDKKNKRYYNTEVFSHSWMKQQRYTQNSKDRNKKDEQIINKVSKNDHESVNFSKVSSPLAQKPFYSISRAKVPENFQQMQSSENISSQKQFENQKFQSKMPIREQISQFYISGQNSKKRFQTQKKENDKREIESEIFLENQHHEDIQNEETIPEIQIQEYIFKNTYHHEKSKNQESVSQICDEHQENEQRLSPRQNQLRNSMKNKVQEDEKVYNQEKEVRKLSFSSGKSEQIQKDKENIKVESSHFSKIEEQIQHKSENTQEIDQFEEYQFKDLLNSVKKEKQKDVENKQFLQMRNSNKSNQQKQMEVMSEIDKLKESDWHEQLEEMSEIDKLKESQSQDFQLRIRSTEIYSSPIKDLSIFQNQYEQTQHQVNNSYQNHQNTQFTMKKVNSQKNNENVIITQQQNQSQSQSLKSQRDSQLVYTFGQDTQHIKISYIQHEKQNKYQSVHEIPAQQKPKQKVTFTKTQKPKQNYLSQRIHPTQEGYSKRSRSKSKQTFIPFSKKHKPHHHKQHCFQSTNPQPFIFKDYSDHKSNYQTFQSQRKSSRSSEVHQKLINKVSPKKQPKVVKVNLAVNKKAEDLFTKHKNQFLNKLKTKQNVNNRQIQKLEKSRQKSAQKSINLSKTKNSATQKILKNRPISPYIEQLSQRLYSHRIEPVCQHYKNYSKRELRQKFFTLILQDSGCLLKHYYFSSDQLNEIFVDKILNKQLNENNWISIIKKEGQRKLQNIKLRQKQRYRLRNVAIYT